MLRAILHIPLGESSEIYRRVHVRTHLSLGDVMMSRPMKTSKSRKFHVVQLLANFSGVEF